MSNEVKDLEVLGVEMREVPGSHDEQGNPIRFPVVLIGGISLTTSPATGNQSWTLRTVSMAMNNMTKEQAEKYVPVIREQIKGRSIVPYEVPEYTWTTPQGEIRTDTVRYRLSYREGEPAAPSMESQVFGESTRTEAPQPH